jgi:hypothetical protein
MSKEDKRRKYTRREFLKRSGKLAGGAALYGAGGWLAGKAYQTARDFIRKYTPEVGNKLSELDNKTDSLKKYDPRKVAKKVEEARGNFWRKIFGRSKEDQAEWREEKGIEHPKGYKPDTTKDTTQKEEKISRRGFFKKVLGYAHKHPKTAGTTAGVVYGGAKTYLNGRKPYKTKKEIAELKDEIQEIKEKLEDKEQGDLEKKVQENGNGDDPTLLALGIAGLIVFIILGTMSLTGFAISNNVTNFSINATIFVIFLIITLVGIKRYRRVKFK